MAAPTGSEPYFILAGDYGGAVYLTCPARLIKCSEETLRRVHAEFERLSGDEQEGRCDIWAENHAPGDRMNDRAEFHAGLWVERWLADLIGLEQNVRAILLNEEEHRHVFRPKESDLLDGLLSDSEDHFVRAVLAVLVLAGFHGHLSTPEDRSFWKADIWALRAGWEVGKSGDADNLEVFVNCATRPEHVLEKLSDMLRFVEEKKPNPLSGSGSSTRFVLAVKSSRVTLPSEIVESATANGVTLLPEETLRNLAQRVLGQLPSTEDFFLWLVPGIPTDPAPPTR